VAFRAAHRILDLAAQGERDPERLKVATLACVAGEIPTGTAYVGERKSASLVQVKITGTAEALAFPRKGAD
jgi:hypothetical protein